MEKFNFNIDSITQKHPFLGSLQFYLSKNINSTLKNHRLKIRQEISSTLGSQDNHSWITNLEQLPQSKEKNISISHCKAASGFATIDHPFQIGIDIELEKRITKKIIDRISKPQESLNHPRFTYIWPAKEAAWKACQRLGLARELTQIETVDWQQLDSASMSFKVITNEQKIDGLGVCVLEENIIISFFVVNSTFI